MNFLKVIYYRIANRKINCPRSCKELCDLVKDDGRKNCWSYFGKSNVNITLYSDEIGNPIKIGEFCPGGVPSRRTVERLEKFVGKELKRTIK